MGEEKGENGGITIAMMSKIRARANNKVLLIEPFNFRLLLQSDSPSLLG